MIELKEMTLRSFLYKVKEKAETKNTKVLFSWTKKIAPKDAIHIFDVAESLGKDRIFWRNHTGTLTFVGIGSVLQLIAEENRFQQLQRKWEEILQQAIIHNPYNEVGTGLVTLGGMSFDPLRPKSSLWEKYPTSQLTIPEYVFVQHKDQFYLTMNRLVHEDENIHKLYETLQKEEQTLLHSEFNDVSVHHRIMEKKEIEPERWKDTVSLAVEEIKQQKAKKIVLAREMRIRLNEKAHIPILLRKLLETQPNSYIFAFEHGDHCFLGATPERLVQVEGENLLSTCLAGTARRGQTVEEDERIAQELLNDQKNRKEHDYVVKMIKESIEPYCENVHIPKEPVVYPLRNLQHLYTPVTAKLKRQFSVFDIIEQLHPTPALGGVPKEKALQFMRDHELLDRGWYGAPIGWLDSNENSEFAVAIRSGLVQKDEISLFAGCGVMRDSTPEMEYEETNMKFLPMLTILEDHHESY